MSEITPETVRHLAGLARIALSDDEIARFAGELDRIAGAVSRVREVATADTPATSHPVPLRGGLRADEPGDTLSAAAATAAAPDAAEGRFRVSAILGEEQ